MTFPEGVTLSRPQLEALWGMSDREVRRRITALRRAGEPIVACPDGGYKLAETAEERRMLLNQYWSRIRDQLYTVHKLEKLMQCDGQLTVEGMQ